jgi:hypothetical protein
MNRSQDPNLVASHPSFPYFLGLGAVFKKFFGKKGSNRLYFIANGKACQGFCVEADTDSFGGVFDLTKRGKA